MSRSYTYNIVVSRSSEAIEKLFFDDIEQAAGRTRVRKSFLSSFQNLDKKFKEDILISPFNNDEFISFETDLPGAGNARFTTLRLVETQRILEKFVIPSDGVTLSIANKFRKKVKDLKNVDSDTLAAMRAIRPRYYISFGVGDDISTWAGPFSLDLIDANLTLRPDGVRELELGFTPTLESLKVFTNKLFLDRDLTTPFDKNAATVEKLQIETTEDFKVEVIGLTEQAQRIDRGLNEIDRRSKSALERAAENGSKVPQRLEALNNSGDRWNYAIRSLFKKFIAQRFQSLPEGNILILFPQDLDIPASDDKSPINVKSLLTRKARRTDIISLYKSILAEYGIGISSLDLLPGVSVTDPKASNVYTVNNAERNRQIQFITEQLRELKSKVQTAQVKQDIEIRQKQLKKLRNTESFINKEAERVGGEFDALTLARQVAKAKLTNPDQLFSEDQRAKIENIRLYLLSEIKADEYDGNILEVLRPLYKFFRTLKDKTGQFIDPVVFEENDLRVTNLLFKYGIIQDAASPVLFVGDYGLIRELVYSQDTELPPRANGAAFSLSEDRTVLQEKWANYKKESGLLFRDRRGRRSGLTSSFGEAINFEPYPKFNELVTPDTIVFMHNLKNSNVLDVSYDSSPYKAELLTLANEATYSLLDQAIQGDQVILDRTTNVEDIKKFVDEILQNSDSRGFLPGEVLEFLRGNSAFLKTVKESPTISGMRLIDFLDLVFFKDKLSRDTEDVVAKFTPGAKNKLRKDADVIRRVNKYVIEVNIKTLPFFNTTYYLDRNCILLGAPNKIIGTSRFAGQLPPPSIFSNKYRIFGYKHVMTPTEAYSQFTLFQDGYNPVANLNITVGEYFAEQLKLTGLNPADYTLKTIQVGSSPRDVYVNKDGDIIEVGQYEEAVELRKQESGN